MPPIICRTLRHEFRLHTPHKALHEALRFMEIAPDLPDFDLQQVDIDVLERDGSCSAVLPGGIRIEGSPGHLMSILHEIIFRDVERSEPDAVFVHGATVLIAGRRVLLVGQKGSGKTTLAVHLVAQGHQIEGDEHVLVRPVDVVARPRTLRVKPGTLALVPGLAERAAAAPFVENWDGTPIRALSPAIGGKRWSIRPGRVDAVICLTANHGGRSQINAVSIDQAFGRLVEEIVRWPENIVVAASRLRSLLAESEICEMLLGDLSSAESLLKQLVAP